jgi:hypothetical protein
MNPEQARAAFELRMKLSEWGFRWKAVYPEGISPPEVNGNFIWPFATTSESGIKSLISDYPLASQTAIIHPDGREELVTECPMTAAELQAFEAQRLADLAALEQARKAAAAAKERRRKEVIRRARGCQTRAEWLKAHSNNRPWIGLNVSRATYYRRAKQDKTRAVGG